ncbi:MAG: glutathione synthase [Alistipes senegalensis]|nr:glutathione synthase [Oxalobacter formigenes]MCM1280541.1 glutathione synthase [Alistipes senegalensis]
MRRIAFLADPLDSFKVAKDSTFAMMTEAARRGCAVYAFELPGLAFSAGQVTAQARQVALTGEESGRWYETVREGRYSLADFDAVIVRKDPPFDMDYLYGTCLLDLAEAQGVRVVNRPCALRNYNEKLAIGRFPEFIPPTLVGSDEALLRAFHAQHREVIFKPLDGMGGTGIFRVQPDGMNIGPVIETLTGRGQRAIMAQRFIPDIRKGDKRVLVIGGRVVPYALARIPQEGETRGNLAAGASGVSQPLSARDREIAGALAPRLAADGVFLAGLDIIGDWLTEINVTSPTCFREITRQTGFDVAGLFFDALGEMLT